MTIALTFQVAFQLNRVCIAHVRCSWVEDVGLQCKVASCLAFFSMYPGPSRFQSPLFLSRCLHLYVSLVNLVAPWLSASVMHTQGTLPFPSRCLFLSLSLLPSVSVSQSLSLSVSQSLSLSLSQSLSVSQSLSLSTLSLPLSTSLCLSLPLSTSLYLSLPLSTSLYLSLPLSLPLSTSLYLSLYLSLPTYLLYLATYLPS